jgi:hypothetical protein
LAKAEADAEHHKAHADKLWEATHKELSYEPENAPERVETVNRVGVALVDFNVFEASVSKLTAERDAARVDNLWLTEECDRRQRRAEAAERASKVDADALQTSQQWLIESNEKINVLQNDLQLEQAKNNDLRKDLQEITIELEVAEDEAQVLTERLAKEQKAVLELTEQNDLLTLELDSRRTAFLQMVVEMGKVSKEMLRT